MYVGKSMQLDSRKRMHELALGSGKMADYEKQLKKLGLSIIFEPIEVVGTDRLASDKFKMHQREYISSMEVYWIHQMKAWGFTKLLNTDFMKPTKSKWKCNYFDYKYI